MKLKEVSKYFAVPARVFTTVLVLLVILVVVQIIISGILLIISEQRYRAQLDRQLLQTQKSEEQKRTERIKYRFDKEFTPDGTIYLVGYITDPLYGLTVPLYGLSGEIKPGLYAVYDVNYNLLWTGRKDKIPYEYLSWQDRRDPTTTIRIRELQTITPEFSRSLVIRTFAGEEGLQIWRYEPKGQLFKGYEAGGDPIGYISAAGFTKSKADVKPFGTLSILYGWITGVAGGTLEPVCVLRTDRRFFEVDFARKTVELLFESPQAKILRDITFNNWAALESEPSTDSKIRYRPTIHCITEDRNHHLIMRNPKEVITVRMPKDWHSLWVEMTATEQTVFLERTEIVGFPPEGEEIDMVLNYQLRVSKWREETKGQPTTRRAELYKLNEKGGLEYVNGITWEGAYPGRDVPDFTTSARYVSFTSPQLYDIAWSLWAERCLQAWRPSESNLQNLMMGLASVAETFRPKESILHWMVNILMVAVVFWHGWSRRTGWGKFVFWIVFVGLFNLAGLLTYLALNHTPVISCPACGKKRGLERLDCINCGSDLPRPQKRETDLVLNF